MSSKEDINIESICENNSKDRMLESKPKAKMIRILTVLMYVLSVSMAAILLSIYYIFMWDGRPQVGTKKSNYNKLLEQNINNSFIVPRHSAHISDSTEFLHNRKKINSYVPSADAQRIVNETNNDYENYFNTPIIQDQITVTAENDIRLELRQQITAMEVEEYTVSPIGSTTTTEESVTWSDDYEALVEFKKSSTFIRKIMGSKYYEIY